MNGLSPRQQSILNRVIDQYIETAQPVGSQSITLLFTELYQGSYSPATVRNEMMALEQMGYLTHPHTSAGRIPTDLGYRYYVDHGLREGCAESSSLIKAEEHLMSGQKRAEERAELASVLLSELSGELSLFILPMKDRSGGINYRIFIKGISRILQKPEFQSPLRIRQLLEALEERMRLVEYFQGRNSRNRLSVMIGRENSDNAFTDCAVIVADYSLGEELSGAFAVIGPTRMPYNRTVSVVGGMSKIFSRVFMKLDWEESV